MYHDIRIVGDDDDLPVRLLLPQPSDEQLIDECVVQIIFRLIQNDRLDAVTQYESKQGRSLLAGRSLRKGLPWLSRLPLIAKAHRYGVFRNVQGEPVDLFGLEAL
jgi:hypothetical protein